MYTKMVDIKSSLPRNVLYINLYFEFRVALMVTVLYRLMSSDFLFIFLTVHLRIILVSDQLDAQFHDMIRYIY